MMWVALLFFAGMTLILAEFILPGGICGVLGVMLLIGSGIMAVSLYPEYTLFIVVGESVSAVLAIALGAMAISKWGLARGLVLEHEQDAAAGYIHAVANPAWENATGVAMTPLRPAGTVVLNGERVDAVSNGTFIAEGTAIRVVEVHGNRVVVEPVEEK